MIIDCHTHLYPATWRSRGQMPADMFDIGRQVERMDRAEVATCVVSDPHIWYGDLDVADIAQARAFNEFAADLARDHPGRFAALATVTPWRGDEHVAEAQRSIGELGLAGLAIATSDQDRYLDTVPDQFWEYVAGADVPVFVHPGGRTVGQELMTSYRLGEVCGRPLDMTVTLARFILTGVFARYPGLRLLCAHAGGAISTVASRLDFGHELRDYTPLGPWGPVELERPPSTFVEQLYVDTVTFGTAPLRLALDTVGPGHVCFGTDCPPVPFSVERHLAVVDGVDLGADQRDAVLAGNARALFAL